LVSTTEFTFAIQHLNFVYEQPKAKRVRRTILNWIEAMQVMDKIFIVKQVRNKSSVKGNHK